MKYKVRLRRSGYTGSWYGEVYDEESGEWEEETTGCYTRFGARWQLMRNLRVKNEIIEEFEVEI